MRIPSYVRILNSAGYPETQRGELTDAVLDAVVIRGDEAAIADGLRSFMEKAGASELIACLLPVSSDPGPELERAMRLIASL